jgi:hypothetical protein
MSASPQPPDPLSPLTAQAPGTRRDPPDDADPPIISAAGAERHANLLEGDEAPGDGEPPPPRLYRPVLDKLLVRKFDGLAPPLTAEQRLLFLDTWRRFGVPAGDFASLVGMSKHTLYAWTQRFEAEGRPRKGG